jgi:hypothetical protein
MNDRDVCSIQRRAEQLIQPDLLAWLSSSFLRRKFNAIRAGGLIRALGGLEKR